MNCSECGARMTYHDLSRTYTCPACGHRVPAGGKQSLAEQNLTTCMLALRFYADGSNYDGALPILADRGSLAREVLGGIDVS